MVDLFPLHRSSPPIYGVYGQLYDTLTANTFWFNLLKIKQ